MLNHTESQVLNYSNKNSKGTQEVHPSAVTRKEGAQLHIPCPEGGGPRKETKL